MSLASVTTSAIANVMDDVHAWLRSVLLSRALLVTTLDGMMMCTLCLLPCHNTGGDAQNTETNRGVSGSTTRGKKAKKSAKAAPLEGAQGRLNSDTGKAKGKKGRKGKAENKEAGDAAPENKASGSGQAVGGLMFEATPKQAESRTVTHSAMFAFAGLFFVAGVVLKKASSGHNEPQVCRSCLHLLVVLLIAHHLFANCPLDSARMRDMLLESFVFVVAI